MHLGAHTEQASNAELLFLLILWEYPKVCCQVSSHFAFADSRKSCKLSDAALQFLTQAHQSTCATRHSLHKAGLSPASCSSWVCLAGSADAKNAPVKQHLTGVLLAYLSAWGSYMNFSFPQNIWASHCACFNANMLPSATWGSSKPATSEAHGQEEKWNRWSWQASAPPSAN